MLKKANEISNQAIWSYLVDPEKPIGFPWSSAIYGKN